MKTLISFVLMLALLHTKAAAQNLSGIWKGKMTVDTPRYDISFEMALDDKNGNISGYITRTVVLNDTFFYSLVKVKATIRENRLILEDAAMVSNNFPERRSGIRQTTVFFLDQWRKGENVSVLPGNWSTNRLRGFMGLSGVVQVERQENYVNTQIFRRMQDQNLLTSISFIKPEDIPKKDQQMIAMAGTKAPAKTDQPKEQPAKQPAVAPPAKPNAVVSKPTNTEPFAKKEDTAAAQSSAAVVQKPVAAVTNLPASQRQPDSVVALVQRRPAELINSFDVRSDSLVLALYDNGEIDGDTVSVFVNDQLVISKQGLSATAFRKTIYFEPGMGDSIRLVLFAENLGSIPPNTGLLLVNDGDLRYEVYFSASLNNSTAIILRRRKKD